MEKKPSGLLLPEFPSGETTLRPNTEIHPDRKVKKMLLCEDFTEKMTKCTGKSDFWFY
jgi:hypothetical protein